jgi:uncharacterized membrane protein
MTAASADEGEAPTDLASGVRSVLVSGIVASAVLLVVGVLLWASVGFEHATLTSPVGPVAPGSLDAWAADLVYGGLVILVATPIARVAYATRTFARLGDRTYAAVTAIVLALLVLTVVLGYLR